MKNVFAKKRKKAGMSRGVVADALNIPLSYYEEIERGARPMPTSMIDSFNSIVEGAIKNPSMARMNEMQSEADIEEWFNAQMENDKEGLNKLMKKFNISKLGDLSELLGYSRSTLSGAMGNPERYATPNLKVKLYDFFNNELNIQTYDFARRGCPSIEEIQEAIEESGLTINEICKKYKISKFTLEGYLNGAQQFKKSYDAIKKFYNQLTKDLQNNEEVQTIPTNIIEDTMSLLEKLDNSNTVEEEPQEDIIVPKEEINTIEGKELEERMEKFIKDNQEDISEILQKTIDIQLEEAIKLVTELTGRKLELEKEQELRKSAKESVTALAILRDELEKQDFNFGIEFYQALILKGMSDIVK